MRLAQVGLHHLWALSSHSRRLRTALQELTERYHLQPDIE
jgi:hypothetical protein